MSNVYPLRRPEQPQPPRELSDEERDGVVRSLRKIAAVQYYPLNRLLMRLAAVVRDYPLEEVTLKDLAPAGYMMSVDYPTYGLHWVFRLEGTLGPVKGCPVKQLDLLTSLQKGVKALGFSTQSARFSYRFLEELGGVLRIETVDYDHKGVVVSGCIQAMPFATEGLDPFLPFRMTLTRL